MAALFRSFVHFLLRRRLFCSAIRNQSKRRMSLAYSQPPTVSFKLTPIYLFSGNFFVECLFFGPEYWSWKLVGVPVSFQP